MALLFSTSASATILTFSSPSPTNNKAFNTPRLNLSRKSKSSRARNLSIPRVAAPPTPSPTTPVDQDREEEYGIEDEDSEESSSSKFSWRDHWYPVSLIEDLNPKLPTPFQLLGRDIVLWFDKSSSEWVAFEDKRPHRLAPLSEGRIDEGGNLQCSYHGWSFDGCGSCVKIPQASPEGPEARAIQSPRACATRFPTMQSQGLLFVWPDENGWERARATKPPMLPDDFDKPEFSSVTIQRDLFYGYDTLMENVSDPSHIDFAHHKVIGRRDRANDGNPQSSAELIAPCYYINNQQELGSSTTIHNAFSFLISLLLTPLQFKNQNFGNLFETHGATMLLFIMAVLVYAIALAGISKPTPNTSYIPMLMRVYFIFGASGGNGSNKNRI